MSKLSNYSPPTTVEELLRRYTLGERYFADTDLPDGASFSGQNLEGVNFERSFLHSADFSKANLQGVSFQNSNVKCSDFSYANLRNASFRGASVEATRFIGACVEGVSMEGAGYYGITIRDADSMAFLENQSHEDE
jgi:uncharacterized protein YjbI with pentapeptide repeats